MSKYTSKEWTIQPRTKPGRKSAATPAAPIAEDGPSTSRSARERRQDYIQELEGKVRALEQGDGERSVLFQQENDMLKSELATLRQQLQVQPPADNSTTYSVSSVAGVKRPASITSVSTSSTARKRRKNMPAAVQTPVLTYPRSPSPISDDDLPYTPYEGSLPTVTLPTSATGGLVHCGLCVKAASGDCVCAQLLHDEADGTTTTAAQQLTTLSANAHGSISVAIRRPPSTAPKAKIWAFERPAGPSTLAAPVCSGDPKTCPACSDDACVRWLPTNDAADSARRSARRCRPQSARRTRARAVQVRRTAVARCPSCRPSHPPATIRTRSTRQRTCRSRAQRLGRRSKLIPASSNVVARRTHCAPPEDGSCSSSARRLTVEKSAIREAIDLLDRNTAPAPAM